MANAERMSPDLIWRFKQNWTLVSMFMFSLALHRTLVHCFMKFQVDSSINLVLSSCFRVRIGFSMFRAMSGCAKCSSARMCTSCNQALFWILSLIVARSVVPPVIGLTPATGSCTWQVSVRRSSVLWSTVLFCWLFCYFYCDFILSFFSSLFLLLSWSY